ncbi:hypothetical protein D9M70_492780 [compost metagenome]
MHGRADLRHFAEQLHVRRRLVEVIVAHQAAVGFAAELAVLFLVHLLEHRTLVPGGPLELLQRLVQLALGDAHHADLQLLVGLGVVHQVVQAAPCAFQLLEVRVVQDQVDLRGQLGVDRGDDRLDGGDRVVGNQVGARQRLFGQGAYRGFHRLAGALGLGFEFLQQQGREFAGLLAGGFGLQRFVAHRFGHGSGPPQACGSGSVGFGALTSACSNAGSLIAFKIISSAPVLPSM